MTNTEILEKLRKIDEFIMKTDYYDHNGFAHVHDMLSEIVDSLEMEEQ